MIYIYIKICNHCGLKYLGKSIKDIEYIKNKYKGSGKYWKRHLNKYNPKINTLIINEFEDIDECKYFCLWFSKINNIVISKKWANLIYENGLNGGFTWKPKGVLNGMYGKKHKKDTIDKIRKNGNKFGRGELNPKYKGNKGKDNPMYNRKHSEENKNKMRKRRKSNIYIKKRKDNNNYRIYYYIRNILYSKTYKTLEEAEEHQKLYIELIKEKVIFSNVYM